MIKADVFVRKLRSFRSVDCCTVLLAAALDGFYFIRELDCNYISALRLFVHPPLLLRALVRTFCEFTDFPAVNNVYDVVTARC